MIWHSSTAQEVLSNFNVDKDKGLDSATASERLNKYKENEIHTLNLNKLSSIILNEIKSKFNIFLFVLSLLYFIVSLATKYNGTTEAIMIIVLLAIRMAINIFREYLTTKHLNKYSISVKSLATVIRNGEETTILASQLVPGDIILLKEGDYIPADARLIDSYVLKCDEFSLTGEIVPIDKIHDAVFDDITPIPNRFNMVYCGTNVINGQAKAVVTGTGAFTEISKAENIENVANSNETQLKANINSIEKITTSVALAASFIVFLVTLFLDFNAANVSFALIVLKKALISFAFFSCATNGVIDALYNTIICCSTKHMEDNNVIPINVTAAENLKDISVICTDKTGVITSNNMSVAKVYDGNQITNLETDGINESVVSILRLALICSNLEQSEHYEKHANSMECAIEKACIKYYSMSKIDIDGVYPKLCELPFTHDRRLMTIVTAINGKPYAIVKGAPEVIAARCNRTNEDEINKVSKSFAEDALKVISVAMKPLSEIPANPNSEELEYGLTFVGVIGIEDPIHNDIVSIIKNSKQLNKKIIMLTGDHISTAIAVAKRIGILPNEDMAISCEDLASFSDDELAAKIKDYTVFARTTSEDKLRIVKALQQNGEKVLVTGDSIKDSYALRQADIGCSMGLTATDMVNYSADIILKDNKFSSIFSGINESFKITEVVKKGIGLILGFGILELVLLIIGSFIFKTPPISTASILFFNIVLLGLFPTLLALEKNGDLSDKISSRLIDVKNLLTISAPVILLSIFSLMGFGISVNASLNSAYATTFAILGLGLVLHSLSLISAKSLISSKTLKFRILPIGVLAAVIIILLFTLTPLGQILTLGIIPRNCTILIIVSCVCTIVVDEIIKIISKYL